MARPNLISTDTFLAALADHPGATAADLAEAVGIGQSTSAKRLVALETAGTVQRVPGGRAATGRRAPDRWSLARDIAEAGPAAPDTAAPDTRPETAGPDTPAVAAPVAERARSAGGNNRLVRGALGTLVLDYLAGRPTEAFGPSAVAKALGRSAGAISNSLDAMAIRGQVDLVGDKPRRYRIAAAE